MKKLTFYFWIVPQIFMEIFFLGTGGGRFSIITQKRRTGGIRIIADKVNMHLDPGPGALIYSLENGLDPRKINMILISHAHPDHYTDGEILVEAMTGGALKKSGCLICARSVTTGNENCGPAISRYHKNLPSEVVELKAGEKYIGENIKVEAVKAVHYDPDTVGFKITFSEGFTLGYTSDTEYFDGVGKVYENVDLLILCVIRPRNSPLEWHMCVDDAIKILGEAKPKKAIITHFGMRMITYTKPEVEAKYIEEQTGIPTIAAYDGMQFKLGKLKEERKVKVEKKDLTSFF
ncbi:MBL fold metallo-hydrolase [Candidatus Bathyarchaeota archaeon]|nr:MAG: MBL fold metallo-hydrolase [Candidatus Bathyarchaeota archaeon]